MFQNIVVQELRQLVNEKASRALKEINNALAEVVSGCFRFKCMKDASTEFNSGTVKLVVIN